MVCLVQERHVGHRAALGLGVQHYVIEEPFALTAKCAVLAFVAPAGRNAIALERVTNLFRLERIHRLTQTRSAAWHGCDEPFTFVVPAQEAIKLRLLIRFADEKEQVALLR